MSAIVFIDASPPKDDSALVCEEVSREKPSLMCTATPHSENRNPNV